MNNNDLFPFEEWRDIPNMKYHYQVSNLGRVCRLTNSGNRNILSDYHHQNNRIIELFEADGKRRKHSVITLVGDSWLGRKEGYIYITRNGVQTDVRVSNIMYAKRSESCSRNNKLKRKPVMKIDRHGNVVEIYPSVVECSKHTFLCKTSIAKRCRGLYESILAPDGFAYCYEDNFRYLEELGNIFQWERMGKFK